MNTRWTVGDFDSMSWHDNHVHGLSIREGAHGLGELILDLDYILEWVCEPGGSCRFRVAPATLRFLEVADLRIAIDYRSVSAGLVPFSIGEITRGEGEAPDRQRWGVVLNWPPGEITFTARGFDQTLSGEPRLSDQQRLMWSDRGGRNLV